MSECLQLCKLWVRAESRLKTCDTLTHWWEGKISMPMPHSIHMDDVHWAAFGGAGEGGSVDL